LGLRALAICAVLILIVIIASALVYVLVSYPPTKPASPVPVGAVLYLWYGYGSNGSGGRDSFGWNVTGAGGGLAVVDKPVIGYYFSDSNSTFRWQVQQMEQAGLSFALVSWWGNTSSGRDGAVNKATLDLFKFLKETDSNFSIAVMVDAYNGTDNLSNSTFKADYNYVFSSFVKPFGNWYFDWHGRPLLLFFSPLVPSYNDSRFTVRSMGNYDCRPVDNCQEPNWVLWTAPNQFYQGQGGKKVNYTNDLGNPVISDGEVTIVPRIDSYHYYLGDPQSRGFLRFDSDLTLGLYQYEWNYAIQHKSQVGLLLIYSWNEYYERSATEPHYEPTGILSPLTNDTKSYAGQLR
jgi:hypothetical protein